MINLATLPAAGRPRPPRRLVTTPGAPAGEDDASGGRVPEWSAMLDALDHLAQGIMLVDGEARLRYANRAAHAMLATGNGLYARADGLRTASHAETEALRRLVRRAAGLDGPVRCGGTLALSRRGQRPLAVMVAPANGAPREAAPEATSAVVFVSDPDRCPAAPAALLQALYGLTRTETAVALAVAEGDGLPTVAARLGIMQTTARSHLQRVFEKTGTRRQAELVRLILQSGLAVTMAERGEPRDDVPRPRPVRES